MAPTTQKAREWIWVGELVLVCLAVVLAWAGIVWLVENVPTMILAMAGVIWIGAMVVRWLHQGQS